MSDFHESIRYEYPELNADSVVIDCGGFEGEFAETIHRKYGCIVHVLEPVPQFYFKCKERLKEFPKIHMHPYGIYAHTRTGKFKIKGNMTGIFSDGENSETVILREPKDIFQMCGNPDLIKLNIEGAEMDVIGAIIHFGLIRLVKNLQVQWHSVFPNAEAARDGIIEQLKQTHELTFDFGWTWQNYRLKI